MPKIAVLLFSLFALNASAFAFETALPPLSESPAFQQFSKQPKSELSKLIFLLNRFKESRVTVFYDKHQYTAAEASKIAKDYLVRHYHKEPAEYWIRNYLHKTPKGNEILVKGTDADIRHALDLALQELKTLEAS